jgi:hypothetical protein
MFLGGETQFVREVKRLCWDARPEFYASDRWTQCSELFGTAFFNCCGQHRSNSRSTSTQKSGNLKHVVVIGVASATCVATAISTAVQVAVRYKPKTTK